MQLNSGTLNSTVLSGSSGGRSAINFEGSASTVINSGLTGIRFRHGKGDALIPFISTGFASVTRSISGIAFPLHIDSEYQASVYRSGTGFSVIRFAGNLYYVKPVYGAGNAVVDITLFSDVGVVYLDGALAIEAMIPVLDASRRRLSSGTGILGMETTLSPSAIRQATPAIPAMLGTIYAGLDPSVNAGGINYIGIFGNTLINFDMSDQGMLRQANLGEFDLELLAGTGTLTVRRPTLDGDAIQSMLMEGSLFTDHRGAGSAIVGIHGSGDGEIYVRGTGEAVVRYMAVGTFSVFRPGLAGEAVISLSMSGGINRARMLEGSAVTLFNSDMDLKVLRSLRGRAVIEALSFGNAVVNNINEDLDSQIYTRPETKRNFERKVFNKVFKR